MLTASRDGYDAVNACAACAACAAPTKEESLSKLRRRIPLWGRIEVEAAEAAQAAEATEAAKQGACLPRESETVSDLGDR